MKQLAILIKLAEVRISRKSVVSHQANDGPRVYWLIDKLKLGWEDFIHLSLYRIHLRKKQKTHMTQIMKLPEK